MTSSLKARRRYDLLACPHNLARDLLKCLLTIMLAFNHAVKLTSTLTVDNRTPSASRSRPAGAQASCQADNQAADSGYVSQPDASSQEPGIARDSRPVPVSAIENTIAASAQNVPLETAPEPESANIRSSAGT